MTSGNTLLCTCLNISFSAEQTSSTDKTLEVVPVTAAGLLSYLPMNQILNRRIQAMAFLSFSHEEYRSINLETMSTS